MCSVSELHLASHAQAKLVSMICSDRLTDSRRLIKPVQFLEKLLVSCCEIGTVLINSDINIIFKINR